MNVAVVGHGFVGEAVCNGLCRTEDIIGYDIKKGIFLYRKGKLDRHIDSTIGNMGKWFDIVVNSDIIFLCLPTPMGEDGECDISIVEKVTEDIDKEARRHGKQPILIIKSTVVPGTTKRLSEKCQNCVVFFNPEFLTEANHIEDYKNQDRIILGLTGDLHIHKIRELFAKAFPNVPIYQTSSTIAELVKYTTNCFLTVKVSFANEMFRICEKLLGDASMYDEVIRLACLDKRLGDSHWKVPGPDGKKGWGGSCFPKDLGALIHFASSVMTYTTMDGARFTNQNVREEGTV